MLRSPAVVASLAALAAAQEPPAPVFVAQALDSGYRDWRDARGGTLHVGAVTAPGTAFLQLWFGDCNLPAGSRLRLRGARDGAVQSFDAGSLRDYGNVSAFFNGDRVEVELVMAPGSTKNRVVVTRARVGETVGETDGICSVSDTRVLSNDPRVGRIDGCCTTFLVDERTLCTAGHCIGSIGGQLVNFNVPLSDPNGVAQFPPPDDQYALLPGSLTSVNGGVGNDYAVMSTVRNSNTGLYPGQAQGSWLHWIVPPASTASPAKVTGYGTSTVNPTWSLAQKTGTGPRTTTDPVVLSYRADVSGCNSGSPVIQASTDEALGVVTHAGCLQSGLGANLGTGFGQSAFRAALQALQQGRVAGTTSTFGQGCGGAFGVPVLACVGFPDLGGSVALQVSGLNPGTDQPGLLLFGFSATVWNGSPLPAPLAGSGMPGCTLLIGPETGAPLSTNFGASSYALPIPNNAVFLAALLYAQYFAFDASATTPLAAVDTNAARITVGN